MFGTTYIVRCREDSDKEGVRFRGVLLYMESVGLGRSMYRSSFTDKCTLMKRGKFIWYLGLCVHILTSLIQQSMIAISHRHVLTAGQ